jgi:hypothetical protein
MVDGNIVWRTFHTEGDSDEQIETVVDVKYNAQPTGNKEVHFDVTVTVDGVVEGSARMSSSSEAGYGVAECLKNLILASRAAMVNTKYNGGYDIPVSVTAN